MRDPIADELTESVRAEAAVWLALLHSDARSLQLERIFNAWLADDAMHAAAFKRLSAIWETTGALRRPRRSPPTSARTSQRFSLRRDAR